jgi:hypothetical protein
MLTINAHHASASDDGDYLQVAFEERRDEEGSPYLLIQRQFEDEDGDVCYVESHDAEFVGHLDGRAWKVLLYGVPVGLISGTLGILEALVWAVGGVADTATAGYFEIGTDDATQLSLMPVLPLFIPDSRRPRWAWGLEDRCGRPRVAPEPPPPTPGPLPSEKLRP